MLLQHFLFQLIFVLLIITLISGGLLAVLNDLLFVSEEETLNRAIKKIYGQEMTATVEIGELTIFVSNDNEKKLVTNKDNLDTLYSLSSEFGIQNIRVINGKAEDTANPEEIAKAFFQDALKIKKEN